MAVTLDDVRHVASLARLGLTDERARVIMAELNTILEHMAVLQQVDTEGLEEAVGVGAAGAPLRPDAGPPIPLARELDKFGPRTRDGFFLVPRLATHEDTEDSA